MLSVRAGFETMRIHQQMGKVADLRRRIREAGETTSDRELQLLWMDARDELDEVTLFGDLVLVAFFEGDKPKKREAKRAEFANAVASGNADCYGGWLAERRDEDPPLAPFHWELEFPEVFERDNPGFDAIVGNPPFAGKNTVTAGNVDHYPDWLKQMYEQSHGNADLVAHFFRRAFNLVREGGAFGLIATNTIAQGDTRSTGVAVDLRKRRCYLRRHSPLPVAGAGGSSRQCDPCLSRGMGRKTAAGWSRGIRHHRVSFLPGRPR